MLHIKAEFRTKFNEGTNRPWYDAGDIIAGSTRIVDIMKACDVVRDWDGLAVEVRQIEVMRKRADFTIGT